MICKRYESRNTSIEASDKSDVQSAQPATGRKDVREMMTIDEMNKAKAELHYTNEMIASKSGVPLPTVQKVLSGTTKRPRYKTLVALEAVFKRADRNRYYEYHGEYGSLQVRESGLAYDLYGTGDPETTDTTYPFDGEFIISPEGLPIHPRYKIPIRRQGDYTTDDLDLIPDDIRVELIDGVIYDLASPTSMHQVIAGTVYTIMSNYAMEHDHACMPYIAPLDVKFDRSKKTRVQPDVLVVCASKEESGENADGTETEAPDFIMEVLSPSTRRIDMVVKLNKYYKVGVREYWIVDPDEEEIIVYDFENNRLNIRYTFDDEVPVAISGGDLKIDFKVVRERLATAERIEKSKPWELLLR